MGDLNCHFGHEYGLRFWGNTTTNAKKIGCFVKCTDLVIADSDTFCTGPKYTFNIDGVGTSCIDHVICSGNVYTRIRKCEVLEDSILNTSDHLAIQIEIEDLIMSYEIKVSQTNSVKWHKMNDEDIKIRYTDILENSHDLSDLKDESKKN